MSEHDDDDARIARRNYLILCIGATVAVVLIVAATVALA
jgi:hypothetical protein